MSVENGKTPLEDTITTVFKHGATLQKEINSLQDTQTEEGQARLNELVHIKQPENQALLNDLQDQEESGGYYLGLDNPF
ncbi:hypothetical protein [Bathymodiolus platifrons methanotrophic gill symbiont]|uniref:hypothetical protein n=1 Tax=Bathymodiolus platifrons methanotrophic gill symbiont TaxID=113268 RepID=UPI001C8E0BC9|nr:hypothetical protein [Bathymodiolus platifrons methanotrophic gill symbiont]